MPVHFIIPGVLTGSHLEAHFKLHQLCSEDTLSYIQNHRQIWTYLQIMQEEVKNMLDTNEFTGAEVSKTAINNDKRIDLTA